MAHEPIESVGVRQFREKAAEYLNSKEPIAVTRHGRVVGLYFPVPPEEETKRALDWLSIAIERVRSETGMTEEQLSDWFNLRKPLPE